MCKIRSRYDAVGATGNGAATQVRASQLPNSSCYVPEYVHSAPLVTRSESNRSE